MERNQLLCSKHTSTRSTQSMQEPHYDALKLLVRIICARNLCTPNIHTLRVINSHQCIDLAQACKNIVEDALLIPLLQRAGILSMTRLENRCRLADRKHSKAGQLKTMCHSSSTPFIAQRRHTLSHLCHSANAPALSAGHASLAGSKGMYRLPKPGSHSTSRQGVATRHPNQPR